MKVLIFGGTTEGRELAELLFKSGFDVTLSVATDYGKSLAPSATGIKVLSNRLNSSEIAELISDNSYTYVVDATHPYADIITNNVKRACSNASVKYLRLLRNESLPAENVHYLDTAKKAAEFLSDKPGTIFLTVGSKELSHFAEIADFARRCVVRILPMPESLQAALELGFAMANIICMKGPFNEALNEAMFRTFGARFLVTKDSGDIGGFAQKISAAQKLKMEIIVIKRPSEEEGYDWKSIVDFFRSL